MRLTTIEVSAHDHLAEVAPANDIPIDNPTVDGAIIDEDPHTPADDVVATDSPAADAAANEAPANAFSVDQSVVEVLKHTNDSEINQRRL